MKEGSVDEKDSTAFTSHSNGEDTPKPLEYDEYEVEFLIQELKSVIKYCSEPIPLQDIEKLLAYKKSQLQTDEAERASDEKFFTSVLNQSLDELATYFTTGNGLTSSRQADLEAVFAHARALCDQGKYEPVVLCSAFYLLSHRMNSCFRPHILDEFDEEDSSSEG